MQNIPYKDSSPIICCIISRKMTLVMWSLGVSIHTFTRKISRLPLRYSFQFSWYFSYRWWLLLQECNETIGIYTMATEEHNFGFTLRWNFSQKWPFVFSGFFVNRQSHVSSSEHNLYIVDLTELRTWIHVTILIPIVEVAANIFSPLYFY